MKAALAAVTAIALVVAAHATAALVPTTYDPGSTGCVSSTYANGTLHLAKTCATSTNAAAQADVTGLGGQQFASATFTLANAAQCQGGSPRFNLSTSVGTFFLGCNNVGPTTNADGTATYTFTAQTLAAAGQQVPTPTGTIQSVQIVLDVQGSADLTKIAVNGVAQTPFAGKDACKHGGWKALGYRNQGRCVSHHAHLANATRKHR
jgi:hypothetical protein